MCSRVSDARCAAVPNLGRVGRVLEDFLPRLCGGSRRPALKVDDIGKMAHLQGTTASIVRTSGRGWRRMLTSLKCDFMSERDFSRASSDSTPLPAGRLRPGPEGESGRATTVAPRRWVEDRREEGPSPSQRRWLPRRKVRGGWPGVVALDGHRHHAKRMSPQPEEENPSARFILGPRARSAALQTGCP